MFLTTEDYLKIESWLKKRSVRDTDFEFAKKIDGSEQIAIIQNGKNVRCKLSDVVASTADINVVNDSYINGSDITEQYKVPFLDVLNKLDDEYRKLGIVVSYQEEGGSWKLMQYNSDSISNLSWLDLNNWSDITDRGIKLSAKYIAGFNSNGEITKSGKLEVLDGKQKGNELMTLSGLNDYFNKLSFNSLLTEDRSIIGSINELYNAILDIEPAENNSLTLKENGSISYPLWFNIISENSVSDIDTIDRSRNAVINIDSYHRNNSVHNFFDKYNTINKGIVIPNATRTTAGVMTAEDYKFLQDLMVKDFDSPQSSTYGFEVESGKLYLIDVRYFIDNYNASDYPSIKKACASIVTHIQGTLVADGTSDVKHLNVKIAFFAGIDSVNDFYLSYGILENNSKDIDSNFIKDHIKVGYDRAKAISRSVLLYFDSKADSYSTGYTGRLSITTSSGVNRKFEINPPLVDTIELQEYKVINKSVSVGNTVEYPASNVKLSVLDNKVTLNNKWIDDLYKSLVLSNCTSDTNEPTMEFNSATVGRTNSEDMLITKQYLEGYLKYQFDNEFRSKEYIKDDVGTKTEDQTSYKDIVLLNTVLKNGNKASVKGSGIISIVYTKLTLGVKTIVDCVNYQFDIDMVFALGEVIVLPTNATIIPTKASIKDVLGCAKVVARNKTTLRSSKYNQLTDRNGSELKLPHELTFNHVAYEDTTTRSSHYCLYFEIPSGKYPADIYSASVKITGVFDNNEFLLDHAAEPMYNPARPHAIIDYQP